MHAELPSANQMDRNVKQNGMLHKKVSFFQGSVSEEGTYVS